jgi:hypothetical protein
MEIIAEAVGDLPGDCQSHAGNALLRIAAETVAHDVGFDEASRMFARVADLLARRLQPPADEAILLNAHDAWRREAHPCGKRSKTGSSCTRAIQLILSATCMCALGGIASGSSYVALWMSMRPGRITPLV